MKFWGEESVVLYEPSVVEAISDATAREFLASEGLPEEHLLFAARQGSVLMIEYRGSERKFMGIGEGGTSEEFCVDCASGAVVTVNHADESVWHVSASIGQFAKCLKDFTARDPFYPEDSESEVWEEASAQLRRALESIDETAFSEDPGFWHTILMDVAIGDYAEE